MKKQKNWLNEYITEDGRLKVMSLNTFGDHGNYLS